MTAELARVAIIGAGYISDPHAIALTQMKGVSLVAVCDLSPGRAASVAAHYGIPASYTDLDAMLAKERLDAVHVLTPPDSHEAISVRVLDAGVDVLLEKPICATAEAGERLARHAAEKRRVLGVSHNFLFSEPYEGLRRDIRAGRFGALDQVDIVWNKDLGQVKAGPHTGWLFARPENVLVEVGTHSFAHVVDMVGELDRFTVSIGDPVQLPNGIEFHRRWELVGWRGQTSIRLRWSFIPGYPEHYIHVRGRSGSGFADFERNTYQHSEHTAQILDLDRFAISATSAGQALTQGTTTLGRYLLSKLGVVQGGKPFGASIARAAQAFHESRVGGRPLDERLRVDLAVKAVTLAQQVGSEAMRGQQKTAGPANGEHARSNGNGAKAAARRIVTTDTRPTILVLGGTGFIGRVLVERLVQRGRSVRVLARDPRVSAPELKHPAVEVVPGDFTNTASVVSALKGIDIVYHLARGHGSKWAEYELYDVEPTKRLAEACADAGVRRLFYTSTIAIYWAGKRAGVITDTTPPHAGVARTSLYARAKVAIEKALVEIGERRGLEVVIFRPGVVIGKGGAPLHWGVGAWPYPSVCRLWGDGNHPLPFVLVDDCAEAMVRALDVTGLQGKSYNLVGDVDFTGLEYLDAVEQRSGVRIKRVVTTSTQLFLEETAKFVIKAAGRDPAARLPSWFDGDGRTLAARFDCSAAKRDLGWCPTADRATLIREGIERPVDEFLS